MKTIIDVLLIASVVNVICLCALLLYLEFGSSKRAERISSVNQQNQLNYQISKDKRISIRNVDGKIELQ